jgi:hypothetical protein
LKNYRRQSTARRNMTAHSTRVVAVPFEEMGMSCHLLFGGCGTEADARLPVRWLLLRQPIDTGDGRLNELTTTLIGSLAVLCVTGAATLAWRAPPLFLRWLEPAFFIWQCLFVAWMAWSAALLSVGHVLGQAFPVQYREIDAEIESLRVIWPIIGLLAGSYLLGRILQGIADHRIREGQHEPGADSRAHNEVETDK